MRPDGYDAFFNPPAKSENVSSLMSTGNVDDVSGSGLSRSTPHFTYPVISVVKTSSMSKAMPSLRVGLIMMSIIEKPSM